MQIDMNMRMTMPSEAPIVRMTAMSERLSFTNMTRPEMISMVATSTIISIRMRMMPRSVWTALKMSEFR